MRGFTDITSHQPTIPPSTYPTPNPTLTHSPNHPPQLYPCTQPPPHSPTHLAVASAVSAAGVGDSSVEQRPSVCCLRSCLQSSQSLLPPPTDSPGSVLLDSGYLYINQDTTVRLLTTVDISSNFAVSYTGVMIVSRHQTSSFHCNFLIQSMFSGVWIVQTYCSDSTLVHTMPRPTIPERSLSKYKVTKQKMEGPQLSVTH